SGCVRGCLPCESPSPAAMLAMCPPGPPAPSGRGIPGGRRRRRRGPAAMKIAEIFYSIQGEGRLAGVPSAFVRTSGCNLRGVWRAPASPSGRPGGEHLPVAEGPARLEAFPTRHAVVTGGEPLLAPEVEPLCAGLRQRGYHITVETAATVFRPVACDL